ncbi:MAG: hypothetical protein K2X35_10265 [Bryobacteraceae bacterium]|jgi:hypothetical protein|nr:hypothetical protein [Bryobacteraceae bacterium]
MSTILLLGAAALAATARPDATKVMAIGLIGVMLFTMMLAPQPAYGQFGLGGITGAFNLINQAMTAMQNFINNVMKPLLEGIQSAANALQGLLAQLRQLWEEIVWPLRAINEAKALAQQLIGLFRGTLNGLYGIGVNSAQLPNPVSLETIMRNKNPGDHGALVTAFRGAFGPLPAATEVHPEERNLIDVDDAMAIDQLMTLKMGDAGADRVLQAAEAVEDEARRFAPGTAAMASAAAYIAAMQSQAHMQKMIAGQLRQEAARLAHETMAIKRGASFTRETRDKARDLNK